MYETWYKMGNMLVGGLASRLSPLITHRYRLEDYQVGVHVVAAVGGTPLTLLLCEQKGFDVMRSGNSGKVVLDFD